MTLVVSVSEARYGRWEPVLHEIGFEVAAGEVLAVVGANGAGKTTLFRALMGRVATRGSVALDGTALPL